MGDVMQPRVRSRSSAGTVLREVFNGEIIAPHCICGPLLCRCPALFAILGTGVLIFNKVHRPMNSRLRRYRTVSEVWSRGKSKRFIRRHQSQKNEN